ncbi:hypothetical protein PBY51_009334 [Eleginops maclovinus]|uniref:Uncharacterized protein n=1 Tax=Eleginops maclovinus TaxID=56733 RepID=A0AAN7XYE0_ELEMC|nr:hypothetical protein PBY51_009334 [Eleginops maclovinus]
MHAHCPYIHALACVVQLITFGSMRDSCACTRHSAEKRAGQAVLLLLLLIPRAVHHSPHSSHREAVWDSFSAQTGMRIWT